VNPTRVVGEKFAERGTDVQLVGGFLPLAWVRFTDKFLEGTSQALALVVNLVESGQDCFAFFLTVCQLTRHFGLEGTKSVFHGTLLSFWGLFLGSGFSGARSKVVLFQR